MGRLRVAMVPTSRSVPAAFCGGARRSTRGLTVWAEICRNSRANQVSDILSLRLSVAQRTDELPTAIASPHVRKSGGAVDEYRHSLIVLRIVPRGGRRRHRPERDFVEKRIFGTVMR